MTEMKLSVKCLEMICVVNWHQINGIETELIDKR